MGIIQAFTGALSGTFADQWKDIITAGHFAERTAVAPGLYQRSNNGRGTNFNGSADIISNGSKIFVPENTAAFIFSQAGIEDIITQSGGYEYRSGMPSIFAGDGFTAPIIQQAADRIGFGGQPSAQKYLAFVNLREMRGLKFGTRGPMVYHDRFYGADLEILAFGTFSLRIVDAVKFVQNFLPASIRSYSFDSPGARQQISAEFMQAFLTAVNSLSATYRISELPSQSEAIAEAISDDESTLGSWIRRYGIDLVQVGIENIELSPASRELVNMYAENKMNLAAYEGISQQASDVSSQQKIAQGVQNRGLGDGGGMLFGMNLAQAISPLTAAPVTPRAPAAPTASETGASAPTPSIPLNEQLELVRKLKELLDAGILTQAEFDLKKNEIMGF